MAAIILRLLESSIYLMDSSIQVAASTPSCQVWNALEVDKIIQDPLSGYGIGSGLLFGRWSSHVCLPHPGHRYEGLPCWVGPFQRLLLQLEPGEPELGRGGGKERRGRGDPRLHHQPADEPLPGGKHGKLLLDRSQKVERSLGVVGRLPVELH